MTKFLKKVNSTLRHVLISSTTLVIYKTKLVLADSKATNTEEKEIGSETGTDTKNKSNTSPRAWYHAFDEIPHSTDSPVSYDTNEIESNIIAKKSIIQQNAKKSKSINKKSNLKSSSDNNELPWYYRLMSSKTSDSTIMFDMYEYIEELKPKDKSINRNNELSKIYFFFENQKII